MGKLIIGEASQPTAQIQQLQMTQNQTQPASQPPKQPFMAIVHQQPVLPKPQGLDQSLYFDGKRYLCEDFRLPTMNKTSFYKLLKGQQ